MNIKKSQLKKLIGEKDLSDKIRDLGDQISSDFSGKDLVVIGVLKGAIIFMADLVRSISTPLEFDFIRVSSYAGKESTGVVNLKLDVSVDLENKNVVIIEDIIDTGNSIEFLVEHIKGKGAATIKVATLLFKPEAYQKNIKIDYVGFEIENQFVVGFGLDCDEQWRELPFIAQVQ